MRERECECGHRLSAADRARATAASAKWAASCERPASERLELPAGVSAARKRTTSGQKAAESGPQLDEWPLAERRGRPQRARNQRGANANGGRPISVRLGLGSRPSALGGRASGPNREGRNRVGPISWPPSGRRETMAARPALFGDNRHHKLQLWLASSADQPASQPASQRHSLQVAATRNCWPSIKRRSTRNNKHCCR